MSAGAAAFLAGSWAFVLGLTAWAFARILRVGRGRSARGRGGAGLDEIGG